MRLGVWNCRRWALKDNENARFRKRVLQYSQCDISALTDTFLRGEERLNIQGYVLCGHNRTAFHKNTTRGSVGVDVLVKKSILETFDICVIDSKIEGISGLKFTSKLSKLSLRLAACHSRRTLNFRVIL